MSIVEPTEVKISGGRCKIVHGPTKRVFHTTEEALGLFLLKVNPAAAAAQTVVWQDFLATNGVATAAQGDKRFTMLVHPSHTRTIVFRRGDTTSEHEVTLPDLLMAYQFHNERFVKGTLWIIKPGQTKTLTAIGQDHVLAAYSYGNVYNHGGICWGTTRLTDLRTPQDVFDAFFASAFNGDLYAFDTHGLLNFLTRNKVYPTPANSMYTKSVGSVAAEITRTS